MRVIKIFVLASLVLASLTARAAQPAIDLSKGGKLTPGVYGQVKFGKEIPPLVYPEPKVIAIYTHPVKQEPIYLYVPPAHAKQWDKHCREYKACSRPAYFVKSREYEPGYVAPEKNKLKTEKESAAQAGKGDSRHNGRGDGSGDGTGKKQGTEAGGKQGKGDGSGGGTGKNKGKKDGDKAD